MVVCEQFDSFRIQLGWTDNPKTPLKSASAIFDTMLYLGVLNKSPLLIGMVVARCLMYCDFVDIVVLATGRAIE
jgi:hypothetical protein